jgi:K+-transporting ATPase KdpF subunit
MTGMQLLAAVLVSGLLVYLCIALLMPEKFQ